MKLSTIGFGALSISGMWDKIDSDEAIETMNTALDNGINWIDTSPIYGNGHADLIIKCVLRNKQNIFVSSKCGRVILDNGIVVDDQHPKSIQEQLFQTLRSLGLNEVDLYQCHSMSLKYPVEEVWGAMSTLVKRGLVKNIGVCNYDYPSLVIAHSIHPVYSIQLPFNLLSSDIDSKLIHFCKNKNIKIIAYSPLKSGALSEKFSLKNLREGDRRLKRNDLNSDECKYRHRQFVAEIGDIAATLGISVTTLAIAWLIQHENISHILLGIKNKSQLIENLCAMNVNLDDKLRHSITKKVRKFKV